MANASVKIPDNGRYVRYHKYESIRIEWSNHFKNKYAKQEHIVQAFFKNFHLTHRGFQFVVAELFDGTTHVLVESGKYLKIKDELEKITGRSLPDVSNVSDVKVKERARSFCNFQSHRDFSLSLKMANDKIKARRKEDAKKSVGQLRRFLQTKPNARMMTFDVETYENDHSVILEIGFAVGSLARPEDDEKAFHFIIRENSHFVNKDYVPDNREKFSFGTSERMSLKEAAGRFMQHIKDVDFLVTHSGANDEAYLASSGISLQGKPMFDTQLLALALLTSGTAVFGLKRLLSDLAIPFDENILHNGGNDAVYTMKVFRALAKMI